jgi:two-component system, cell cycle response regulator DivK
MKKAVDRHAGRESISVILTIYLCDNIDCWIYFHKMLYPKCYRQVHTSFASTVVRVPLGVAGMTSETVGSTVSRKKILIVEDNELSMRLVNDLLEFHGYELFLATVGADALRIARGSHPDLILLNLRLPDMSGLDVARALKADETTKAIPIVAVTGFAMRGDEQTAREAGCDGYVAKPIRIQAFLQTVETFLASSP